MFCLLERRFYVHDVEDRPTVTTLYETWFHWQTGKYQMADSIAASVSYRC